MKIYNVTIKIEHAQNQAWLTWMQSKHIPDVLATGCFKEARLCRVDVDEDDGVTYAIQYTCNDANSFEYYEKHHATALRAEHDARFSGSYVAFRTLLDVIAELPAPLSIC